MEKIISIISESLPEVIRPIERPRAMWKNEVHKDMQKWDWKRRTLETERDVVVGGA